jgi:hypothetical protein
MIEYVIDSIEFTRCLKTNQIILKSLVPCDLCYKLPIPQYKSYRQQNSTYCKSCFMSQNLKPKYWILPNKMVTNMLEQVVISCKNSSCGREFNINSLNEMLDHERHCGKLEV